MSTHVRSSIFTITRKSYPWLGHGGTRSSRSICWRWCCIPWWPRGWSCRIDLGLSRVASRDSSSFCWSYWFIRWLMLRSGWELKVHKQAYEILVLILPNSHDIFFTCRQLWRLLCLLRCIQTCYCLGMFFCDVNIHYQCRSSMYIRGLIVSLFCSCLVNLMICNTTYNWRTNHSPSNIMPYLLLLWTTWNQFSLRWAAFS